MDMSMDGMDGMDMGDMDMSHTGMTGVGSDVNHAFARGYWYIAAAVVALLMAVRAINHIGALQRLKASQDPSIEQPTRPNGPLSQAWATATAIVREMSHPQLHVSLPGLAWASPPPAGRLLALLAYWAVIVYLMAWRVTVHDGYYYERIAYRNAWVTLAQLPMLYLLASKTFNPLALLIGTSHERLNWLHRWVARTMLVTATCHGFHFYTEWVRADFVTYELAVMPMVKYGLGAWAVLLWSVLVGFLPLRRLCYEAWLLQHVASSVVMLVLVYIHIPTNGRYLFWMTIAFFLLDRAARWALLLWQNVHLFGAANGSSACRGERFLGHSVTLRAVGDSTTVAVIKDAAFRWSPGQHLYIWVPRLGPLEAHPYTIACAHRIEGTCCCNSIQLIVRKHAGFSKRLHDHAVRNPDRALTGFLSGPYGAPPRWDIYETMVLIGASTGASFTLPILESAANSDSRACLRRMDVVLIAKTRDEIQYYLERSREAGRALRRKGVDFRLHVAITGSSQGNGSSISFDNDPAGATEKRSLRDGSLQDGSLQKEGLEKGSLERGSIDDSRPQSASTAAPDAETGSKMNLTTGQQGGCCCTKPSANAAAGEADTSDLDSSDSDDKDRDKNKSSNHDDMKSNDDYGNWDEKMNGNKNGHAASQRQSTRSLPESFIEYEYACRPDIETLIREPVEQAWGETAVVVCGGPEVVARTRNRVIALSDERAVHKGTGAQGIHLHVEEYSF